MAIAGAERATRSRSSDTLLCALPIVHLGVLALAPPAPVIAILMWWSANTVAHHHIHRPSPASATAQRIRSAVLSLTLGVPQSLWRHRHLEHHAGTRLRSRPGERAQLVGELLLLVTAIVVTAQVAPRFLIGAWLPGLSAGLVLCALHGRFEHRGGQAVSHYGRLYNALFMNDGYHAEHHLRPTAHFRDLPALRCRDAISSRCPAIFRGLPRSIPRALDTLERWTTPLAIVRRWLVRTHASALRPLLADLVHEKSPRVLIVGGGLFPRTALVLRAVLPAAHLTILDENADHLERARAHLGATDARAAVFLHAKFDPGVHRGYGAVFIPLAYRGDRSSLESAPPAEHVFLHEWIALPWSRRARSGPTRNRRVVSLILLKRLRRVDRAGFSSDDLVPKRARSHRARELSLCPPRSS